MCGAGAAIVCATGDATGALGRAICVGPWCGAGPGGFEPGTNIVGATLAGGTAGIGAPP